MVLFHIKEAQRQPKAPRNLDLYLIQKRQTGPQALKAELACLRKNGALTALECCLKLFTEEATQLLHADRGATKADNRNGKQDQETETKGNIRT